MNRINVLITSAGVTTAIGVISGLKKSRFFYSYIVTTDMSRESAALYLSDNYYITPRVSDGEFFVVLKEIIIKEKIDFVFPLHSSEIEIFSRNRDFFKELDVGLVLPNVETVRLCDNKREFYDFLAKNKVDHPLLYPSINDVRRFPVFIKPVRGSSSKGTFRINSLEEFNCLKKVLFPHEEIIIQEFLDWPEITVDCYVNKRGFLVGFVPRVRIKIKDGKAVVSRTISSTQILELTKKILKLLSYKGACNIQLFFNGNGMKVIELNPRMSAGGLPLTIEAGVNIPELMIIDYMYGISDRIISYKKGLKMLRYFTEVFVQD